MASPRVAARCPSAHYQAGDDPKSPVARFMSGDEHVGAHRHTRHGHAVGDREGSRAHLQFAVAGMPPDNDTGYRQGHPRRRRGWKHSGRRERPAAPPQRLSRPEPHAVDRATERDHELPASDDETPGPYTMSASVENSLAMTKGIRHRNTSLVD